MVKSGYDWWHIVIAISFLWLIYVAIVPSHVLSLEDDWVMISIIFLVMFIAGTFWINNVMTKEGYDWWQWTIPILIEWIFYVALVARVLPEVIRVIREL